LLAIDIATGKEHLKLTKQAKVEDIANYFCELTADSIQNSTTFKDANTPVDVPIDKPIDAENETKNYTLIETKIDENNCDQIWMFLDNNSTHKQKMKLLLSQKLDQLYQTHNIEKIPIVEFYHTPAYSPDYNLAEYIIRLIRQLLLHHLPTNTTLDQIQNRLDAYFQNNQLQTPKQIQNTINHILDLVVGRE
jgi:hypothetical protein